MGTHTGQFSNAKLRIATSENTAAARTGSAGDKTGTVSTQALQVQAHVH